MPPMTRSQRKSSSQSNRFRQEETPKSWRTNRSRRPIADDLQMIETSMSQLPLPSHISPIKSMPPEILTDIFNLAISPLTELTARNESLALWRLLAVCKSWKAIVSSSAVLWSSFSINMDQCKKQTNDLLQRFLKRSAGHNLSVTLISYRRFMNPQRRFWNDETLMTLIRTGGSRIETLGIEGNFFRLDPFDELEEIDFNSTTFPILKNVEVMMRQHFTTFFTDLGMFRLNANLEWEARETPLALNTFNWLASTSSPQLSSITLTHPEDSDSKDFAKMNFDCLNRRLGYSNLTTGTVVTLERVIDFVKPLGWPGGDISNLPSSRSPLMHQFLPAFNATRNPLVADGPWELELSSLKTLKIEDISGSVLAKFFSDNITLPSLKTLMIGPVSGPWPHDHFIRFLTKSKCCNSIKRIIFVSPSTWITPLQILDVLSNTPKVECLRLDDTNSPPTTEPLVARQVFDELASQRVGPGPESIGQPNPIPRLDTVIAKFPGSAYKVSKLWRVDLDPAHLRPRTGRTPKRVQSWAIDLNYKLDWLDIHV